MEQIEKEFSIADIIAKMIWTKESLSPGERALLDKWLDGSEENRMFYEKWGQRHSSVAGLTKDAPQSVVFQTEMY